MYFYSSSHFFFEPQKINDECPSGTIIAHQLKHARSIAHSLGFFASHSEFAILQGTEKSGIQPLKVAGVPITGSIL